MDEEARRALEMSREELDARFEGGTKRPGIARLAPLRVRRKQDVNQRAAAIVCSATERTPVWDPATVVFSELSKRKRDDSPVQIPGLPAVTIQP